MMVFEFRPDKLQNFPGMSQGINACQGGKPACLAQRGYGVGQKLIKNDHQVFLPSTSGQSFPVVGQPQKMTL